MQNFYRHSIFSAD